MQQVTTPKMQDYMFAMRKNYLEKLLIKHKSNITEVAEEAGTSRQTIYMWLGITGLDKKYLSKYAEKTA